MSLDVSLYAVRKTCVWDANITHNLGRMAREAGIYEIIWRPDEVGIKTASELIEPLTAGLERLKSDPWHYAQFNPSNGWGDYDGLVRFVESYLNACIENPAAEISAHR